MIEEQLKLHNKLSQYGVSSVYDLDCHSLNELIYHALNNDTNLYNFVVEELAKKTDLYGDHLGKWQGLDKPTLSEEGAHAQVEKNMSDIIDIKSSLETITKGKYYFKENDNLIDVLFNNDVVVLPSNGYIEVNQRVEVIGKKLITIGKPCTIKMIGDITSSVILCGGTRFEINNIILDCNKKGFDGIEVASSDRGVIKNTVIKNTVKSGMCLKATSDWHWIENLQVNNVDLSAIGGHGFYFEVGEHQASFINECSFKNIEIRGIGQMMSSASFIYAHCHGRVQGNKMSVITWENCNFDANRQVSLNNGFNLSEHMAIFKNTSGKNCLYESWSFNGGGWESVSGPPFQTGYTFYAESGAVCKRFFIDGITVYNWTNGKVYNIDSRTGSTLNSDFHLDWLDGIRVRNVMTHITPSSGKSFIQTKEKTTMSFKINDVYTTKTKDYEIDFDLTSLTTSSIYDNFMYGKIKLCMNKFRSFNGSGFKLKEYIFCIQKRNWEEWKIFNSEVLSLGGTDVTMTLNSVNYDHTTKQFKLNITSSSPNSGSECIIYGEIEVGTNIYNDSNFIFNN